MCETEFPAQRCNPNPNESYNNMTQHKSPRNLILMFVAALFLFSGIGHTQQLPDAPSVAVGAFPSPELKPEPAVSRGMIAAKAPLIDVSDPAYWTASAALLGSTIINVEFTARCAQEHTCLTSIAPDASRARLYAYTLSTDAALSFLSYKLRGKSRWWMLPQVIFTSANLFSAGRSYGRLR